MADTRYIGFKEQVDFDTKQAAPMSFDLVKGVDSIDLDAPDNPTIPLPTVDDFQDGHLKGYYVASGPLNYTLDINTIGWFLKWGLGGYKFTAGVGEAPNVHEFYKIPGHTLPYATARVGKDTFEHVFTGAVINKMSWNIENELLKMQADFLAKKDEKDVLRETLNTPDEDLYPVAFYKAQTKIDGVDISSTTAAWGFDWDNGIKPETMQGQNSMHPYGFRTGAKELTMTVKKNFEDTSASLEKFWGSATGPSTAPHTPFAVEELFDCGAFGNIAVKAPKSHYTKVDTKIKGSDPRTPELAVKPESTRITLADTETIVKSPLLITVTNYMDEYVLGV